MSKVVMTRPNDSPVDEIVAIRTERSDAINPAEQEAGVKKNEVVKVEDKAAAVGIQPAFRTINAINKGSKVTGNLIIGQDLEITGDIEGDIASRENANIFILGASKGNITTGGSVEIEGEMNGGDIVAGGYVKVTGKFHGGKIQAKEKIHVNGEFSGTLESREIEVGADAQGTGEIVYNEYLSIEKGARVEGRITRVGSEPKKHSESARLEEKQPVQKKGFFKK